MSSVDSPHRTLQVSVDMSSVTDSAVTMDIFKDVGMGYNLVVRMIKDFKANCGF